MIFYGSFSMSLKLLATTTWRFRATSRDPRWPLGVSQGCRERRRRGKGQNLRGRNHWEFIGILHHSYHSTVILLCIYEYIWLFLLLHGYIMWLLNYSWLSFVNRTINDIRWYRTSNPGPKSRACYVTTGGTAKAWKNIDTQITTPGYSWPMFPLLISDQLLPVVHVSSLYHQRFWWSSNLLIRNTSCFVSP